MPTALYPGSFDPFHLGHLRVVEDAAGVFDRVIVGVLGNPRKPSGLFPIAERVRLAEAATAHLPNVRSLSSGDLTIDVALSEGATFLVRSGHTESGFERTMAAMNERMSGVQTVFFAPHLDTRAISSHRIRALLARGDVDAVDALIPRRIRASVLEWARIPPPGAHATVAT